MEGALQLAQIPRFWWTKYIWLIFFAKLCSTTISSLNSSPKNWRKIVSVSVKKSTKGKGKVSYDVITQVVVNLSPVTCSVKDVSQLVAKQVDFFYVTLTQRDIPC